MTILTFINIMLGFISISSLIFATINFILDYTKDEDYLFIALVNIFSFFYFDRNFVWNK